MQYAGKVKGKEVPLQVWSGPEDSKKLRFPDFMTTAQESGKVVIVTHRPQYLIILSSVAYPAVPYFCTLSHERHDLRGKKCY